MFIFSLIYVNLDLYLTHMIVLLCNLCWYIILLVLKFSDVSSIYVVTTLILINYAQVNNNWLHQGVNTIKALFKNTISTFTACIVIYKIICLLCLLGTF